MGRFKFLNELTERLRFYLNALTYFLNLYSALAVFKMFYRNRADKGLICMGSSNGKFCDENVCELFKFLTGQGEKVFLVIDRNSQDIHKIEGMGCLLYRFSFRANLMILRSEIMIYDTSYVDLIRCNSDFLKHIRKVNIFHGIHGLKKISIENAANRVANDDYVIATSSHEVEIKKSWGFSKERIWLTGLPRFDVLSRKRDIQQKNKIFFMPTWRPWFKRDFLDPSYKDVEQFKNSDYFREILRVCSSKYLNELLLENGYVLEIYVHKLMHRYLKKLDISSELSNIVFLDEKTNVQEQIITSDILITDYSSVFFDFLYLNRSVILYQFDKEKYYRETPGSYIDETEISDLVVTDFESLLDKIRNTLDLKDNDSIQANNLLDKYVKYYDEENCLRVYTNIKKLLV